MDALLKKTEELDKMIDDVLPMLIADQWDLCSEKLLGIIPVLNEFLSVAVDSDEIELSLDYVKDILESLLYSIKIKDTIQIADVLAYKVGSIIGTVYQR